MNRFTIFGLLALLVSVTVVYAVPSSPIDISVGTSSSRQLSETSNSSLGAQGGNITRVDIQALTITKSWQGFYGNVTGNIRLDDANNDTFYVWGNATPAGEVYASRNDTINWETINCTNESQRSDEEVYLGQSVVDGDSATNTFNTTTHPSFFVGLVNITSDSCFSTNAFQSGAAQTSTWHQMMLSDNESSTVYTTIIDSGTVGYNGEVVDFQLMVGENEHSGSEGVTTYYFYTELS